MTSNSGEGKKKRYCHGNLSPSVSRWSLIYPESENMKAVLLHRHAHSNASLCTTGQSFQEATWMQNRWLHRRDLKISLDSVSDFIFIFNDRLLLTSVTTHLVPYTDSDLMNFKPSSKVLRVVWEYCMLQWFLCVSPHQQILFALKRQKWGFGLTHQDRC